MKIIEKKVEDLIPYARNPRKNDDAVDGVAASIAEFGFRKPIVIDDKNVIVAGHTTLRAAKKLGYDTVPCAPADDLTPEQIKAYRLLDNKLAERAEWDAELLALELEEIDLDLEPFDINFDDDLVLDEDGTPEPEDAAVEMPKDPFTRPGDLWCLGGHRVLCGDSTDPANIVLMLNNRAPALCVTDPPYGVEYDPEWRKRAGVSKNEKKMGAVTNDDRKSWTEVYPLIGAPVLYLWHAGKYAKEAAESLEEAGYIVVSQIVWVKERFALGRGDYHWQHEPCWYAVKIGSGHAWQGARDQSTVWAVNAREDKGHGHGTQKPIECMLRPIKNNSKTGDLVVDPFLGSGTTLIAAERAKRLCYGLEIDPGYCDIICQRFYNETGTVPVREMDGAQFPIEEGV